MLRSVRITSICAIALMILLFLPKVWGAGLNTNTDISEKSGIKSNLSPESRSAILIDADSGTVIYEKNSHQKLPPASMTKIATMLLVMEAVDKGKISLKDPVQISEHAASMGGSQIFLKPGEQMSVNDLLKGVAIASGNDASVALAEHLGGSEQGFVQMMNNRVKQLGLHGTHFGNPNGLTTTNHYSTAHDMAILSRELLKHPTITKYTGLYQDYLRKNSEKPFWLVNTNKLVRFYQGVDGLKTGFTTEAKFCLTATAKRNGFRVIAVVMGEPDVKVRNKEVTRLLDYAFNQYTNFRVYKTGDLISRRPVEKGEPQLFEVKANHPYSLLIKKGEDPKSYRKVLIWNDLKAPIHKGDLIGKIQFEKEGRVVSELELISNRHIPKASLWSTIKRTVGNTLLTE